MDDKGSKHNPNKGRAKTSIALESLERFQTAVRSGHSTWVRDAKKYNDFYIGNQWTASDQKKLDESGRPALTINLILSTINTLIGEQLERRIDARFRPVSNGDEETAFRLNRLTHHILVQNHFDQLEEQVFSDGAILDRGYYDIRMSFQDNIMGDVSLTCEDPYDIVIDPMAREADPRTWNEVFISRWQTPDQIELTYGLELAEMVRQKAYGGVIDENSVEYTANTFGKEVQPETHMDDEKRVRRIRVTERQYYCLCDSVTFVDMQTGDMRDAPYNMDEVDARLLAQKMGWSVIKRPRRRVRMTVFADDILLSDDWSLYRSFTVVPFFPYFRRGTPFGIVRNLISPQELLNKTSSQELHIVNTTANSGWIVKNGSLTNMDLDDLEMRGAETGLVIEFSGDFKPEKIAPNTIPTGIDRISQKAQMSIQNISAVNPAMAGTNRADQSGKALEIQTQRGQVQATVVLNNLKRARLFVAEKILELVQDFYTETRVFRIAEERPDGQVNEEEFFINGMNAAGEIIYDVTQGKYSVEIGYQPAGGSEQEVQFAEAAKLRELGVAIPDHVLVNYSQLYKKHEVSEMLKQLQGFAPPTPEQQALMQYQQQAEIRRVELELAEMEAKIGVAEAQATQMMAEAESMDGFNKAAMELEKLRHQKELKQMELTSRVALAARSASTQLGLAEIRNRGQMQVEALRMATKERESQQKSKEA